MIFVDTTRDSGIQAKGNGRLQGGVGVTVVPRYHASSKMYRCLTCALKAKDNDVRIIAIL